MSEQTKATMTNQLANEIVTIGLETTRLLNERLAMMWKIGATTWEEAQTKAMKFLIDETHGTTI